MRRKGGPEFLGYLSRARVEGSLKTVSDHSSLSCLDTSSCDSGTPRLLLLGHPCPKRLELIKVLEGLPRSQGQVLPLGVSHGPPEFPGTYGAWWFEKQGKLPF